MVGPSSTMQGLYALIFALPALAILAVVMYVPTAKIFAMAGKTKYWALLQIIPVIGHIVLLFILAFSKWPAVDGRPEER